MATERKKIKNDTETVLGISWLWAIPGHPFTDAARYHDEQYAYAQEHPGVLDAATVDRGFYERCLAAAGDSWKLKAEAALFYGLVRVWSTVVRRKLFR